MTSFSKNIEQKHWDEWVIDSRIDPDIARFNLISLSGYEPHEYLFYGLPNSERRNDGRVRDKWVKRYAHCERGGWWCSGVDILTGEDSQWGCFKPNIPYKYEQVRGFDPSIPPKIKVVKYEHPPKTSTGIFAFKISFLQSWDIIRRLNDEEAKSEWIQRFCQAINQQISVLQEQWDRMDTSCRQVDSRRGREKVTASRCRDSKKQISKRSFRRLQTACARREYRKIDRLFRAIRNRSRHNKAQHRDFYSGGIKGLVGLEDSGFWQWVLSNPQIPLLITEGAKKAGILLAFGHNTIALPGINNGYRQPRDELGNKIGLPYLIPEIKAFAQAGREIIFVFDQDTNPKTIQNVRKAIAKTGGLLAREGCKVSVVTWNYPEKGVDDLIVARGIDCFEECYKARIPLSKYNLQSTTDLSKYRPLKINERYLGNNLTPPDNAQLIGLRSPKGTGKTEWMSKIVEQVNINSNRALVITHRIQLAKTLCNRFGLDHVEGIKASPTKGALGYGMCIDSLHPKSMARFDPSEWQGATVILDEVEQVIWHLLDSSTCQSDRVSIIENFQTLLRTVVTTGGKIYLADADLSAIALDYIQALIGFCVKTWVVDNVYQRTKKRKLYSYGSNNPTELIANLVKAIASGEKPLIHTTGQKAKSKYGTINLESYLKKLFPHLKILRVDRESVAQPNHPAYGCMENLNQLLGQYDVVICSPVVETGVSINIKKHFNSVWAIAYGIQSVDAVCQTLERLRNEVPRHIWVKKTAKNNGVGNGSTSIKSLLRSQHKLTSANIFLLNQAGMLEEDFDLDTNFSPSSLTTWAKRGCIINAGKNNYRDEVISKLLSEGYELESLQEQPENIESVKQELKQVRQENYQRYCTSVAEAVTPSNEELEELNNKISKTEEERAIERKGTISKLYGVEVTPLLVQKDENGWYPQLQLHYYLSVGAAYLAERDKRSLRALAKPSPLTKIKEQGNGKAFKPDLNKKQLSAQVEALKLIGIRQFLNPETEFTKDNLVDWLENVITHRHHLKTILGVAVNPEKDSAIAVAQRLLKKLGLKLEFKHQIRIKGKPTRVYSGCQLDLDGRSQVFEYWLSKESVTLFPKEDIN